MSIQLPPNSSGTTLQSHVPTGGSLITQAVYTPGEVQNVALVNADGKSTYSAGYVAQSAGVSATTDVFCIIGSATKVVKILQIAVSATSATAGQAFDLMIVKESVVPTGGTAATAATISPWDSGFGAATATTKFFTATPTTGTQVGTLFTSKLFTFITPATTVLPPFQGIIWTPPQGGAAPTLRGTAQAISVTLNAGTPGNVTSFDCSAIWTEE